MNGAGEIEFTDSDSYTGAVKMAASGMESLLQAWTHLTRLEAQRQR